MAMLGDTVPFAHHVRRHRPTLLKYAYRIARNRADAEDLVQETLFRALEKQQSLQVEAKALGWMMMIMRNLFIDHCRRRKTEQQSRTRYQEMQVIQEMAEPEPPPEWAEVTEEQVSRALDRIPRKLRDVYVCKVSGLSYREIADRLAIPESTVGTRLLRARKALKKILVRQGSAS